MTTQSLTNSNNMNVNEEYLLSLRAVRERCFKVQEAAVRNKLQHFDIDTSKLQDIVQFVISIIKRDFDDPSKIPTHGRWRHFDADGYPRVQTLINSWASLGIDKTEQTRRVLDLMVVAVILDLNPSHNYSYQEASSGRLYKKKEGIAIAILEMYMKGLFSANPDQPHRVDSNAIMALQITDLLAGFKGTSETLNDLEERFKLLKHLGHKLQHCSDYFRNNEDQAFRPGNMLDYILNHPTTITTKKGPLILLETIWPIILEIGELWSVPQTDPESNSDGATLTLGDVWSCPIISCADQMVPFHKFSQWMLYSLIEPMEKMLGAMIEGTEQLTPLPDYANGGLLIDTGFITLKASDFDRGIKNHKENSLLQGQPKMEITPMFDISDPVITEWRALTIAYLDLVAERVRSVMNLNRRSLTLSQLMEGGTTSAGKELAEISRPNTQEPPIIIKCDGVLIQ
ncbi:hypothetical protein BDF20DRAFT_310633 [Mycotypha africana]|uniref:uncharacterized protein n=1 Tax=Mycotypha africana TaxID=64632 RepID=UPI002301740F|nr:uncharacterized protein BDF20DRAFT_310633 [Mycotypha africana]KAI8988195.1 hypothetical protein BDF20DRAFT_310633 [Mycotypha africana]